MLDMIGEIVPDYLTELMDRIVATELEQLSRIKPIDSVPYFLYPGAGFPYITHRLSDDAIVSQGADLQERTYTIISRFVADHVGAGGAGGSERLIYQFEPSIVTLFTQNIRLVSQKFPDELLAFSADPITFKRSTGSRWFDNRGIGENFPQQVGFEYSITASFSLEIRKRY